MRKVIWVVEQKRQDEGAWITLDRVCTSKKAAEKACFAADDTYPLCRHRIARYERKVTIWPRFSW